MKTNVNFSQFLLDEEYYKNCSSEEKLTGIFELFDNNAEGILRKNEIRQILICLFVIENITAKNDMIEGCIGNMKMRNENGFECITKDEFVENVLKDPVLSKMLVEE